MYSSMGRLPEINDPFRKHSTLGGAGQFGRIPTAPLAPRATIRSMTGRLLRILGLGFGLAVIIGNTIGAGILRTPGEVAARLPGVWLFLGVWAAGGLYALLGAMSLAELGTMIPSSGGQYVYARRALGDYAGFVVGWSDWLSTCGTVAAVSIVVSEYAAAFVPAVGTHLGLTAASIAVLFAVLQWRGVRWGSRTQTITSALKALGFLALVACCFLFRAAVPVAAPAAPAAAAPLWLGIILSLQAVIFTYDGWNGVIYFSEEVCDPARDVPRSLIGGVLLVLGIYLLVNAALLRVLPLPAVAGDALALGTAARALFGPAGDTAVRLVMIVSLLSGINALQLMASRVLFGMSRDGLFPRRAVAVNPGGTPTTALLLGTAVAVLFVLSGTFNAVIAVLSFFFVANYAVSFVALFVLRVREKDVPRPFRVPGYPWVPLLALVGSAAFLVGAVASDTRNSVQALILLLVSYPAYRLTKRWAKL
jgi:APA family basic amino acid/polyamine antiporter